MSWFKPHYRIVGDAYAGYEVQTWRWWFPFWIQSETNTHISLYDAEQYAHKLARYGRVAKYLGPL